MCSSLSSSVTLVIKLSKKKNAKTIAITGNNGGKLGKLTHISLIVTSNSTPRIQEVHRIVIHIICDIVEREFINVNSN